MKLKGKLGCILLAITLTLIGTWNYVGARDDNVEYAFKLQANYKNSYTDIRYRQTKKAAAQQYVSMGAENNNNTSKTYNVSGYWDEETW